MDLVIKQHIDRTETVSSSFIDTLYQLTKPDSSTGQSLANAVFVGRLQTSAAYEDAVNFLNDKFSSEQDNGSDLQITVLNNNYYIRFTDEEVVRVLTEKGILFEGEGLTIAEAALVNKTNASLSSGYFYNNKTVVSFDEFKYFTRWNTVQSKQDYMFCNATNLVSVDLTNCTRITLGFCSYTSSLIYFHGYGNLPNTLNLINLVSFDSTGSQSSFRNCSGLKYIASLGMAPFIPQSTFMECENLETVNLPTTCTTIYRDAFLRCPKLTTINLVNITTFNGIGQFSTCPMLEYFDGPNSTAGELYLPNLTGTLTQESFKGCTKLTSIASLGSITSIGGSAFSNCVNLATINFPNTITSVGTNAFNNTAWYNNQPDGPLYIANVLYKCKNASGAIVIPNNIVSITDKAFDDCSNLTSVTIGSGVASIVDGVFKGCTALSTIVVDSNNVTYDSRNNCNAVIKTTSNSLVSGCKNTVIPNGITRIGASAFQNCTGLTSLTIPNTVTTIGNSAFYGCRNLTGIISIPEGITIIEYFTFYNCNNLTSVTIPSSVTSIGSWAFQGCTGLTSITINAVTPPKLEAANAFLNNNCPIYVPAGSVEAYKSASGWSSLASRIQAIPTT